MHRHDSMHRRPNIPIRVRAVEHSEDRSRGVHRPLPIAWLALLVLCLLHAPGPGNAASGGGDSVSDASSPTVPHAASSPAVNPAARMLSGDSSGEYWDVRARFEGGAHFLARFWVTNEGPGSHTGIAMGSFLDTDGTRSDFRYGRERSEWTLAGGGRYLEIASAVLDLRPPVGRVELDTNRQGIKIYLRFPIAAAPRAPCARRDETGGFDLLALAAPLDGMAWTKTREAPLAAAGTIDITHGWNTTSEIDDVHRRIEVTARQDDVAVYASVLVAPTGTRRTCLAVVRGDTLLHEARQVAVEVSATALDGGDEAYPIPTRIRLADDRIQLSVEPQRRLLSINPLAVVPQPFRFFLGLRSRPMRSWSDGTLQLRLTDANGSPPLAVDGSTITAVSYSNPWGDTAR